MFTRLENLYRFVDTTVDAIVAQHPEAVHCRPGCADCCHAVFDSSFIEAARLAAFLAEHPKIVKAQHERAHQAAVAFEELLREAIDPATARIRCPLLGDDDLCLAHPVRPINCRTYGTPTVIDGKAHVCGLSGFIGELVYPSIDLTPLQESLGEYSAELAGEVFATRRFPLAWVLLRLEFFLPR